MKRTLEQIEEEPPKALNGFQVMDKDRIKLSDLRRSGFPNVQLQLKLSNVEYTAVISLQTLISRNFKLVVDSNNNKNGPILSFLWQEELPPGLATGRQAANSVLDVFETQEECQKVLQKWLRAKHNAIGTKFPKAYHIPSYSDTLRHLPTSRKFSTRLYTTEKTRSKQT
jgi:hypothetical protein